MWAGVVLCAATAVAAWSARKELGGRTSMHALVQAAAALLVVAAARTLGLETDAALRLGALATLCIAIARIDGRLMIIPDALVVATLALAFLPPRLPLADIATGAAAMAALFYGVRVAHAKVRGVEGLGLGDVKLAAAMGAHLGLQGALLATGLAAGLTAVWIIATRRARPAPFGIGLAAALVVVAGLAT